MEKETNPIVNQIHRHFGVTFNNKVWFYMEKANRTDEETQDMINMAHSSLLHWKLYEKSTLVNLQRGEYMIAKSYYAAKDAIKALEHAKRCLKITLNNLSEMKDFDLAYAYEVLYKAHLLNNNTEDANRYLALAQEAGNDIADTKDKEFFLKDLG